MPRKRCALQSRFLFFFFFCSAPLVHGVVGADAGNTSWGHYAMIYRAHNVTFDGKSEGDSGHANKVSQLARDEKHYTGASGPAVLGVRHAA